MHELTLNETNNVSGWFVWLIDFDLWKRKSESGSIPALAVRLYAEVTLSSTGIHPDSHSHIPDGSIVDTTPCRRDANCSPW